MAPKTRTVAFRIDLPTLELVDTYAAKRGIRRGTALTEIVRWSFGASSDNRSILDEDTSFIRFELKPRADQIRAAIQGAVAPRRHNPRK